MLEWTPAVAVGVDLLDAQHQVLFDIYNRLILALESAELKDEVDLALLAVQDFALEHFAEEQELMAEHQYPGLDQHAILHDQFMQAFLDIKKRCALLGPSRQVGEELKLRTGDWLVEHTSGADVAFASFLHNQAHA